MELKKLFYSKKGPMNLLGTFAVEMLKFLLQEGGEMPNYN